MKNLLGLLKLVNVRLTQYAMVEKMQSRETYKKSVLDKTILNFSGSFIDACRLITIPLPSKSNTATPKKSGIAPGEKYVRFSESSGCSL